MAKDKNKGSKKVTPGLVRKVFLGSVFALIVVGVVFNLGTGTLSDFGWSYVAALCPLGALETMFGNWAFVPRLIFAFAFVILTVLIVGRAFCAWVCPVPPLSSFLKSKKRKHEELEERVEAGRISIERFEKKEEARRESKIDSRHVVLCGALGSAAIFGFPVFCLVCPIGLTFAVVIGSVRLVGFNEPSLSLLFFIAILAVELIFLRKWCSKICPIGALLSLVSKFNKTFRPKADESKCLRTTTEKSCGVCATSCPEHIDPQSDKGLVSVNECTRCYKCAETCPQQAIGFPLLNKKEKVKAELNAVSPEGNADADDL